MDVAYIYVNMVIIPKHIRIQIHSMFVSPLSYGGTAWTIRRRVVRGLSV
jgi:hypothetical protein